MTRLLVALLAVGFLFVACGSEDAPQPTETATTERAEREATVSQQQDQQAEAQEESASEAEVEVEEEESEAQVDELPVDAVGVHKGVRSQRNMLGEPDAPVLIEHFGDFT